MMQSTLLQDRIHAEIVIGCEMEGCSAEFIATEAPKEPSEEWSTRATKEAENMGWICSPENKILCPTHGVQVANTIDYVEVDREAYRLSLSHGPTAHLYAMRLAETAERNKEFEVGQFWRAVYATTRPR